MITAITDPVLPPSDNPHAATIAEYERELDRIWGPTRPRGGWRKREPFDKAPIATLHRLGWLLKRRERLMCGHDVGVKIIVPNERNPARCFFVADEVPAVTLDPRNPASPVAWRAPDASVLAFDLRMPLERVEVALSRLPAEYRSDEGVRAWCMTVDAGVKAAIAAGGRVLVAETDAR